MSQLSFDDIKQNEDEAGILRSQAYFHGLIAAEIEKGIPSERIVLGGFSQGGAMSIMSGITCPTKLGGIFGLSCYLLLQGKIKELVPEKNLNKVREITQAYYMLVVAERLILRQETPIFMGHGDADQVVKYEWGQKTAEKLRDWGWNVDFRTYRGLPHSAHPDEINHLESWLNQRIPALGDKQSL